MSPLAARGMAPMVDAIAPKIRDLRVLKSVHQLNRNAVTQLNPLRNCRHSVSSVTLSATTHDIVRVTKAKNRRAACRELLAWGAKVVSSQSYRPRTTDGQQ
jgi:hypothetical protein